MRLVITSPIWALIGQCTRHAFNGQCTRIVRGTVHTSCLYEWTERVMRTLLSRLTLLIEWLLTINRVSTYMLLLLRGNPANQRQQVNMTEPLWLKFQISTNVQPQKPTNAALMQYATIPRGRTTVRVTRDTLEMDGLAKVNALSSLAFPRQTSKDRKIWKSQVFPRLLQGFQVFCQYSK